MAMALAQAGADVVIVSRTNAECEATAAEIHRETGRGALAVAADVARTDEVDRLASQIELAQADRSTCSSIAPD